MCRPDSDSDNDNDNETSSSSVVDSKSAVDKPVSEDEIIRQSFLRPAKRIVKKFAVSGKLGVLDGDSKKPEVIHIRQSA